MKIRLLISAAAAIFIIICFRVPAGDASSTTCSPAPLPPPVDLGLIPLPTAGEPTPQTDTSNNPSPEATETAYIETLEPGEGQSVPVVDLPSEWVISAVSEEPLRFTKSTHNKNRRK